MRKNNIFKTPVSTIFIKRAAKIAAVKAVLHGKQPANSLKEYRKRPEWNIDFWLSVFPDGHYQCVEFERCWNWDEREVVVVQPITLTVTVERFLQLEQLWRQTPNIDKQLIGSWGTDNKIENQTLPYESVPAMIDDEEEYFLAYQIDISEEIYQQHIKPFWDTKDSSPFVINQDIPIKYEE